MSKCQWSFPDCPRNTAPIRKLICSNGAIQYKKQCQKCYAAVSSALPHAGISGDVSLWEDIDFYYTVAPPNREKAPISVFETEAYHEYLQSSEWKSIRAKVMRRANYICEGCLEAPAEQVHHKNYLSVFRELAYDLVAVCRDCHERAHSERKS